MMRQSYKAAFSEAIRDLARAVADRDEIDTRIQQLKDSIRVLGNLAEEDTDAIEKRIGEIDVSVRSAGMTDAVRLAFQTAKANNRDPLTVPELQAAMTQLGFDFGAQLNAPASLSTIARRLLDNGELEAFTRGDGKRAYAWKGESPIAAERARRARLRFGPPQF